MEFAVKGITFSEEELTTLKLDELKVDSVSPAHLFMFLKGNPVLMLRAGDYVDQDFVDKYKGRGVASFHCLSVAATSETQVWLNLFTLLELSRGEKEKRAAKDAFVRAFGDHYWRQSSKSFLSFAKACFDRFYALPVDIARDLQATSHTLYSRALFASAVSVAHCYIESLADIKFIQDAYNAAFMLDYGLARQDDFNFLLMEACEAERKRPGAGLSFLESRKDSQKERRAFFNHPEESALAAQEVENSFNFPEIIEHIRYHHEQADGGGFPNGYTRSALAQSETALVFADHMAPFEEKVFKAGDGFETVTGSYEALKKSAQDQNLMIERPLALWEAAINWVRSEVKEEAA